MTAILQGIDRLSRLAETVAVALIFGYAALMLAEVVARAQARSFAFTWEFSQYAMAAIFALGAGPAIRHGVNVRITLFSDRLPSSAAKALDCLATLVALVIASLVLAAIWDRTATSFTRGTLATTVTQSPLWIPQAIVLWGLAQLWLDLAARLIRRWMGVQHEWRNADAEPPDV